MKRWTKWQGGKRPVDAETLVEVRYRDTANEAKGVRIEWPCPASRFAWQHDGEDDDIVSYRQVRP